MDIDKKIDSYRFGIYLAPYPLFHLGVQTGFGSKTIQFLKPSIRVLLSRFLYNLCRKISGEIFFKRNLYWKMAYLGAGPVMEPSAHTLGIFNIFLTEQTSTGVLSPHMQYP